MAPRQTQLVQKLIGDVKSQHDGATIPAIKTTRILHSMFAHAPFDNPTVRLFSSRMTVQSKSP